MKDQPLEKESWIDRFEKQFCTAQSNYTEKLYVLDTTVDDIPKAEYISFINQVLEDYKAELLGVCCKECKKLL